MREVSIGVLIVCCLAGCNPNPPSTSAPGTAGATNAGGGQSLPKLISRQSVPTELKQIALFYNQFNADNNRSPKDLQEYEWYIRQEAPRLALMLKGSSYTIVWNVAKSSSSSAVIAYETELDPEGKRYVVMGDGSVKKMTDAELKEALKPSN